MDAEHVSDASFRSNMASHRGLWRRTSEALWERRLAVAGLTYMLALECFQAGGNNIQPPDYSGKGTFTSSLVSSMPGAFVGLTSISSTMKQCVTIMASQAMEETPWGSAQEMGVERSWIKCKWQWLEPLMRRVGTDKLSLQMRAYFGKWEVKWPPIITRGERGRSTSIPHIMGPRLNQIQSSGR